MKLVRGKGAFSFGVAETKLSFNWQSLVMALVVAAVTWVSTDLVPQLTESGGVMGAIAGVISLAIPVILSYIRNNNDVTVEKKL